MMNAMQQAAREARGRTASIEEWREIQREAAQEYEDTAQDQDDYNTMYMRFRQELGNRKALIEANRLLAEDEEAQEPLADLKPMWRCGQTKQPWPVNMDRMNQEWQDCDGLIETSESRCGFNKEKQYHVLSSDLTRLKPGIDLRGCTRMPRNICVHKNQHHRRAIEDLLSTLIALVRRFGKDRAESVSLLLQLDGSGDDVDGSEDYVPSAKAHKSFGGVYSRLFVMLVLPMYKPLLHVFCVAQPLDPMLLCCTTEELQTCYPFVVRATTCNAEVSPNFQRLGFVTHAELCEYMARSKSTWCAHVLKGHPKTLLDWEVFGVQGEVVPLLFEGKKPSISKSSSHTVFKEMKSMSQVSAPPPNRQRMHGKQQRPASSGSRASHIGDSITDDEIHEGHDGDDCNDDAHADTDDDHDNGDDDNNDQWKGQGEAERSDGSEGSAREVAAKAELPPSSEDEEDNGQGGDGDGVDVGHDTGNKGDVESSSTDLPHATATESSSGAVGSGSASSGGAAHAEPAPPPLLAPAPLPVPDTNGYVYLNAADPQSCKGRLTQFRGQPSMRCYAHTGCSWIEPKTTRVASVDMVRWFLAGWQPDCKSKAAHSAMRPNFKPGA
jgi:hypothetical protein